MNLIDILFILLFVAGIALGFFQGMIRLLVVIFAFYLALVLASLYFPAVAGFLGRRFGTERFVGEYLGFAMVLMLSFVILTLAGLYTFRYAKMPGQLQYIDRIVGVFLGVLLSAFMIGVFATLLWNLMIVRGGERIDFPLMAMLGRGVRGSTVLQLFANTILPQVYGLMSPVLPSGARLIFLVR